MRNEAMYLTFLGEVTMKATLRPEMFWCNESIAEHCTGIQLLQLFSEDDNEKFLVYIQHSKHIRTSWISYFFTWEFGRQSVGECR